MGMEMTDRPTTAPSPRRLPNSSKQINEWRSERAQLDRREMMQSSRYPVFPSFALVIFLGFLCHGGTDKEKKKKQQKKKEQVAGKQETATTEGGKGNQSGDGTWAVQAMACSSNTESFLKAGRETISSMHLPRFSEDMDSTSHVYSSMQQQSSSSSHLFEEAPAKKRIEHSHVTPQVANEARNRTASPWSDSNHSSMQAVASSGHHHHTSGNSAAYFHWPPSSRVNGTAEERAAYFRGSQKHTHVQVEVPLHETDERDMPIGQQASTLLDLMTIRAFHSKLLRRFSLGTAIGFRNRRGVLTDIPAIIVFVAHKVHKEWLHEYQLLPTVLEGPGGIWCDVDVVEFSYYGTPALAPKEQVYTELVEGLRGSDSCIGPGSQVASQETYGSLGAIVQSKSCARQVGFLTNRHVAVDLDYPNQKMFHPLPPNLGPSVYLGAVERATSFITDDLWYGIFASMNPETFVRADGAFIPFADCFDMSRVTTTVKGLGDMGEVMIIDLQAPVGSIVGKQVLKVGRSSGLTKGSIMAYALEYNDEKGICFFTDFLIVGENRQAFDLEGDSGSLILIAEEEGRKPRPIGIIWGGTANRGRLKLRNGYGPENWTSGVDLGRLLELLQLSLITSNEDLAAAVQEQRLWASGLVASSSQDLPYQDGGHVRKESIQHCGTMFMPLPEGLRKNSNMATSRLIDQENPSNEISCKVELGLMDLNFRQLTDRKEHSTSNGDYEFDVEDGNTEPSTSKPSTVEELSLGFQLFNRNAKKQKTSEY